MSFSCCCCAGNDGASVEGSRVEAGLSEVVGAGIWSGLVCVSGVVGSVRGTVLQSLLSLSFGGLSTMVGCVCVVLFVVLLYVMGVLGVAASESDCGVVVVRSACV